jgi:hypothetical protein
MIYSICEYWRYAPGELGDLIHAAPGGFRDQVRGYARDSWCTILLLGDGGPTLEEIWIEEPQGQGRLHPDPSASGAHQHRGQGRRDRDTLPATFQRPMLAPDRFKDFWRD